MKKNIKKLLALVLAGSMLSGVSAFAANDITVSESANGDLTNGSGTIQGSGTAVTIKNAELIEVLIPDTTDIFKFVLDPLRLLSKIEDAAIPVEEGSGSVLFKNTVDDVESYSSTSDPVKFINKGKMPLNLKIAANYNATNMPNSKYVAVEDVAKFDGKKPSVMFSLGMEGEKIYKDGSATDAEAIIKVIPASTSSKVELYGSLRDAGEFFTLGLEGSDTSGLKLEYKLNDDVEDESLPTMKAFLTGDLDSSYPKWAKQVDDTGAALVDSKLQIDFTWEFSKLAATIVADTSSTTAKADLTMTGLKKATSTDFTFIPGDDCVGGSITEATTFTKDAMGAIITLADNKLTINKAGLDVLKSNFGTGTITVTSPGAQAAKVYVK